MKSAKSLIVAAFLFFSFSAFAQVGAGDLKKDCAIMKSGKFKYLDTNDSTSYIVMKGKKQVDYSENSKYTIDSDVKWTDDCTYIMTMTKVTIPNFPYKKGDQMKVEITKVEGDIIYYTSTVNGRSWTGKFKKID